MKNDLESQIVWNIWQLTSGIGNVAESAWRALRADELAKDGSEVDGGDRRGSNGPRVENAARLHVQAEEWKDGDECRDLGREYKCMRYGKR